MLRREGFAEQKTGYEHNAPDQMVEQGHVQTGENDKFEKKNKNRRNKKKNKSAMKESGPRELLGEFREDPEDMQKEMRWWEELCARGCTSQDHAVVENMKWLKAVYETGLFEADEKLKNAWKNSSSSNGSRKASEDFLQRSKRKE